MHDDDEDDMRDRHANGAADVPESDDDLDTRASGIYAAQHEGEGVSLDVPPMAELSEAAVLAHAMHSPAAARELVDALSLDHFFSHRHRWIFEAIATLVRAGRPCHIPHVADELKRVGRFREIGEYLTDVVRWTGEEVPIGTSVAVIDEMYRRRRFISTTRSLIAEFHFSAEPTSELLDRAQAAVVELAESAKRTELPVLASAELATPLPELPWLVPALGIAPGPPVLVAGYGYSRKTLAAQAMLVSVASGKPLWGVFATRRGAVLHVDYEQGRRLTQERYQRLARALGVDLASLPIELAALPDLRLDARGAEAILLRACMGKALVLVDSLRAGAPTADENSSDIRRPLDMLARISERTGATFVVIHHAKKPSKDDGGAVKHSIRGSSALFDACSGVFIFEGQKGEPTTVHHEKERNRGITVDDFGIDAEDLDDPETGRPNWGLRVVHLDAEQRPSEVSQVATPQKAKRFAEACERIIAFLLANPGASKRGVREGVEGKNDTIDAALEHLVRTGAIADGRGLRGGAYHVV